MMARYGMLIDTRKCIGCYTCLTACQRQNDLSPEQHFVRFEQRERGTYPDLSVENVPLQCMHCEDAPCVSVCPTGASFIDGDGVVGVNHGQCIGCKYCMEACPYQVRVLNKEKGTVDKCRFCTISALEGAAMCTCVTACLTKARIFGDLDDPKSEISKAILELNAQPIAGNLTEAKVYYVR